MENRESERRRLKLGKCVPPLEKEYVNEGKRRRAKEENAGRGECGNTFMKSLAFDK